jgi:hypothetical protein
MFYSLYFNLKLFRDKNIKYSEQAFPGANTSLSLSLCGSAGLSTLATFSVS